MTLYENQTTESAGPSVFFPGEMMFLGKETEPMLKAEPKHLPPSLPVKLCVSICISRFLQMKSLSFRDMEMLQNLAPKAPD